MGYHLTADVDARAFRLATKYLRVTRKTHGGPIFCWVLSSKYTDGETGLIYYGHRHYMPEIGRWISKDPIVDPGFQVLVPLTQIPPSVFMKADSITLYSCVENNLPNNIDAFGLITLDIPASCVKCQFVQSVLYTFADYVDLFLLSMWIGGNGRDKELSFDWFDSNGTAQGRALSLIRGQQRAAENAARTLPCNTSMSMPVVPIPALSFESGHAMISSWRLNTQYSIVVSKICDGNCCKQLGADVNWSLTASDRTDFNNGTNPETGKPYDFGIPGFRITDRLVNACNAYMNWGGKDFNISGRTQGHESWGYSCGN